jgi:class 3 adenylate cyclase
MVADLEAVVEAAGLRRFALFGSTFSVPWAIEFAVRHPEQVDRLVLTRGAACIANVMTPDNLQSLASLARTNWDMASQLFSDLGVRQANPEVGSSFADHSRRSIDPEDAARWLEDLYASTDVRENLRRVRAPTLILHRVDETMVPFEHAEELAGNIPKARLIALPGSGPISAGDDAAANMQIIVDFLNEGTTPQPSGTSISREGPFRTVLFTDIVGHTEMMQRLGDAKGRDVLREHERITRETLKAHGGAEVKTMGDGFMASFGSVTSAMECAIALQRAFAAWNNRGAAAVEDGAAAAFGADGAKAASLRGAPIHGASLNVRVGLNAGEPIEEDGDLFGATVILASRIAAKAGAGEILVPDTVRGLLSGKGFMFSDRGEFVPKGFDEGVRLWDVRWREGT